MEYFADWKLNQWKADLEYKTLKVDIKKIKAT